MAKTTSSEKATSRKKLRSALRRGAAVAGPAIGAIALLAGVGSALSSARLRARIGEGIEAARTWWSDRRARGDEPAGDSRAESPVGDAIATGL